MGNSWRFTSLGGLLPIPMMIPVAPDSIEFDPQISCLCVAQELRRGLQEVVEGGVDKIGVLADRLVVEEVAAALNRGPVFGTGTVVAVCACYMIAQNPSLLRFEGNVFPIVYQDPSLEALTGPQLAVNEFLRSPSVLLRKPGGIWDCADVDLLVRGFVDQMLCDTQLGKGFANGLPAFPKLRFMQPRPLPFALIWSRGQKAAKPDAPELLLDERRAS